MTRKKKILLLNSHPLTLYFVYLRRALENKTTQPFRTKETAPSGLNGPGCLIPPFQKAATSFTQSCFLSGICFVWFYYGDVGDLCYIHVSLALLLIWEMFKRELKQFRIKVLAHRERKLGKASIASNQIRRCEQALPRSRTYTHARTCRNRH